MDMSDGYNQDQCVHLINSIVNGLKPPLFLVSYGKLTTGDIDQYNRIHADRRMDSIKDCYLYFRKLKPRKRWALCIMDSANGAAIIDTSVIEKALDLPVRE